MDPASPASDRHGDPAPAELAAQADLFVDLACLRYTPVDAVARRRRALQLFEDHPELGAASLHAAAALGDLASARRLLDADPALVKQRGGPRGWEPLLYLCYSRVTPDRPGFDALAVAQLLLERGADPNTDVMLGDCTFTAVTGAMGEGEGGPIAQPPHPHSRALVELLLDAGAHPNDAQGLYNTHFNPSNDWLELFLARGLGANDVVNWGTTGKSTLDYLLGQAVVQGFIDRVRLLLAAGASVKGRDFYRARSHYENAVRNGHGAIAELLLQHGATAVQLPPRDELLGAILRDDEAAVRRLVAAGPEFRSDPGLLIEAAEQGHLASVLLLLDLGFPIDPFDDNGRTALHAAAGGGHLPVVRALVERGASLQVRDRIYGGTPAGWADHRAEHSPTPGAVEVRRYLIDRVTDVLDLVYFGQTARLAALLSRDPAAARIRSSRGRTPLHVLNDDAGPTEPIIELLVGHGAEIDASDEQGRTPLDTAIEADNDEAAEGLRRRGAQQAPERVPFEIANLLRGIYDALNRRDLASVIFALHPDVVWPNASGGELHGHAAVKAYWTEQWQSIDPQVVPTRFRSNAAGQIVVDVHQVVRNRGGEVLVDQMVRHVHELTDGLIRVMKIHPSDPAWGARAT